MKKTTNTKEKEVHPEWLFGVDPNSIEAQEARGQKELIESQQLPKKCNSPSGINAAKQYAKMGIKVLTPSKGDDLFFSVIMPKGWKKVATDHSMWNKLVDDQGRVRAMFFYKAAFYDRDAFINFRTRYAVENAFVDASKNYDNYWFVKDQSTGEIVFRMDTLENKESQGDKGRDKREKCKQWLNANYPEHEDLNAYW